MCELTEEARAARAAYCREWRAKNKDRVADYNRRYWAKVAAQRKEESSNAKANNQS